MKENKTANYIKYAVGEILLVMIGILLALQVNNWSEKRKIKKNIDNTLLNISYDLEVDTTIAASIIKFYETNQKNSERLLKNEITMDNYKECPECVSLVTIYQPLNIQNRGYQQLKNIVDIQTNEKDSLITDITKFYSVFQPIIKKNNDRMEDVVMKNFNDFEEFPWFVDMAQGKFTEEMITYFVESDDYRKRVASHALLAVGNHLNITKQYKLNAESLLERIHKRLNIKIEEQKETVSDTTKTK